MRFQGQPGLGPLKFMEKRTWQGSRDPEIFKALGEDVHSQDLLLVLALLTLGRPLLLYGYGYKASCAGPGYAVICNF